VITQTSAMEVWVTHRTTPSEELRGLEGLWRDLITRSDLRVGAEAGPRRDEPTGESAL
jgi:hypothetical protein